MQEMTKKAVRQFEAIMQRPDRAGVSWRDMKRLLGLLGARVRNGNNSRTRVELNGVRAVIQQPVKESDSPKFTVIAVRRFFREARVYSNEI